MRRLSGLSIRVKLPLMLAGIVLASIMAAEIVASIHVRQAVENSAAARLQSIWSERADALETWAADVEQDVVAQSRNPFVLTALRGYRKGWKKTVSDNSLPDARALVTQAFATEDPIAALNESALTLALVERRYGSYFDNAADLMGYAQILLVDADGTVLFSQAVRGDVGTAIEEDSEPGFSVVFAKAMAASVDANTPIRHVAERADRPGFFLGLPVFSETAEPLGALIVKMPQSTAADVVEVSEQTQTTAFAQLLPLGIGGDAQAVVEQVQTVDHLGEVIVFGAPLHLRVTQNADELLAPLKSAYRALVLDNIVVIAIAICVAMVVARTVTFPLQQLQVHMRAIRRGELNTRVPGIKRRDEIGKLARALSDFQDALVENSHLISESSFKGAAFEGASSALTLVDTDMKISYANAAFRKLLSDHVAMFQAVAPDMSVDTIVGRSIDVFQADPEQVRGILSVPDRLPYRADLAVGDMNFALTFSLVRGPAETPLGYVVEWEDVTERRMQAAVLEAINTRQVMAEFDMEGALVSANLAFCTMTGMDKDTIIGRSLDDLLAPVAQAAEIPNCDGAADLPDQTRFIVPSTKRMLEGGLSTVLDKTGSPMRLLLIGQDITRDVERLSAAEAAKGKLSQEQNQVVETLRLALSQLANGNLADGIDDQFDAQYENLRSDFNEALTRLSEAMRAVVENASAIQSEATEITNAADDLSRRTEKQAATLEETAAAVDQLTTNLRVAAGEAEQANQVVSKARRNAEDSGRIVSKAVDAMGEIESSSNRISRIIGVIDDIAFQTNLLALNAGVEAARAGDAGRGFGVVASEVRALAQRSAEAAREINELILMSGGHVKQGVDLVGKAGSALQEIVLSVTDISQHVAQIATSASEQARGIDEINAAVTNLDQVTQQNAAMFQETTAASHALTQEAKQLNLTVGQFKLVKGPIKESDLQAGSNAQAVSQVAVGQSFELDPPSSGDWEEF